MTHHFDVEDAARYGIAEAVILQNLRFWIAHNRANDRNFKDGRYWTYNSHKAWSKLLPYMTVRQIRGCLERLISAGAIIKGNYNDSAYDRTLWYALADSDKSLAEIRPVNLPDTAIPNDENGKCVEQMEKPDGLPYNPPSSPPDEPEAGHRQNSDGSSVLGTFQLRIDPPPRSEPVPDSRHHDITFAWSDRFKRAFGCDYHFSGRDAATLKRFLAGSRETAEAILKTAEDAWARSKTDRYASRSKMAATLHGLCTAYNDIRLELAGPSADRGRAAEDDPAYTGLGSLGIAVMP